MNSLRHLRALNTVWARLVSVRQNPADCGHCSWQGSSHWPLHILNRTDGNARVTVPAGRPSVTSTPECLRLMAFALLPGGGWIRSYPFNST
jgi:hypothetical protein